jgi:hypothetical protein
VPRQALLGITAKQKADQDHEQKCQALEKKDIIHLALKKVLYSIIGHSHHLLGVLNLSCLGV